SRVNSSSTSLADPLRTRHLPAGTSLDIATARSRKVIPAVAAAFRSTHRPRVDEKLHRRPGSRAIGAATDQVRRTFPTKATPHRGGPGEWSECRHDGPLTGRAWGDRDHLARAGTRAHGSAAPTTRRRARWP